MCACLVPPETQAVVATRARDPAQPESVMRCRSVKPLARCLVGKLCSAPRLRPHRRRQRPGKLGSLCCSARLRA
eukprot:15474718-Alexandrium_andersonii.AAC.1